MKKFFVCVDYSATVHYAVKAETEEQAAEKAKSLAMRVAPYDSLVVSVAYVDEAAPSDYFEESNP